MQVSCGFRMDRTLEGVRVRDFVVILARFSWRFCYDSGQESWQNRVVALTTPSDSDSSRNSDIEINRPPNKFEICFDPVTYVFRQNNLLCRSWHASDLNLVFQMATKRETHPHIAASMSEGRRSNAPTFKG